MELQQIIKDAANKSISYEQYRAFVEAHTVNGTNSGDEVTEALAEYTKLNNQRMKRLDKTLKILPQYQEFLNSFDKDVYFLIITESWCGDAAQTMPMMNKVAQAAGVDFKVVLRDENPLLMERFLTNGGRAIAKLILVDKNTGLPVTTWDLDLLKRLNLLQMKKLQKGGRFLQSLNKSFKTGIIKTKEKIPRTT
ncbi:thioredoxin [Nonlabens ulvanivorans]|nr:thioredoxin family protein [Nonlabens ulvanivorans]GAK92228.1 thioredoxin [Nonlabens ulvanivorans]